MDVADESAYAARLGDRLRGRPHNPDAPLRVKPLQWCPPSHSAVGPAKTAVDRAEAASRRPSVVSSRQSARRPRHGMEELSRLFELHRGPWIDMVCFFTNSYHGSGVVMLSSTDRRPLAPWRHMYMAMYMWMGCHMSSFISMLMGDWVVLASLPQAYAWLLLLPGRSGGPRHGVG